MQTDEERNIDIDTINVTDFLQISHDLNIDMNENLGNILNSSKTVVQFTDEAFERFLCNSNKKINDVNKICETKKSNNSSLNKSEEFVIKSFHKPKKSGGKNVEEAPGNEKCDKMAQYIIDSLFYNTLDDSPIELDPSENLFKSQDTEEENKTSTKRTIEIMTEPTKNLNLDKTKEDEEVCFSKYPKLTECKVILKKIDDENIYLNKSSEKLSQKNLTNVDKLNNNNSNEIGNKIKEIKNKTPKKSKKKKVSLGSISILTYNFEFPPSKSVLKKTSLKTYNLSPEVEYKLSEEKNNLDNNLQNNSKQDSINPLLDSNLSEVNKSHQGEIEEPSDKNKLSEVKKNNSQTQIYNNGNEVLQLKDCSVKVEKMPVLYFKKLFSDKNLRICFLCDEMKLFVSKNGLVSHLKNVHCDEIFNS